MSQDNNDMRAQFARGWDYYDIPTMESLGLANGEKVKGKALYVYVLGSEIGYKIGVSNNPFNREKDSTMSPVEFELLFYANVGMHAFRIETSMKRHYRMQKVRGEWYRLSKFDVNWIRDYFGDRIEYAPEKPKPVTFQGVEEEIEDRPRRVLAPITLPRGYPYHLLTGSPCDCGPEDCYPDHLRPEGWEIERFTDWIVNDKRIDFGEFKKPRVVEPESIGDMFRRRQEEDRMKLREVDVKNIQPWGLLRAKRRETLRKMGKDEDEED